MEALFFLADIVCMLALVFAIVRAARSGSDSLGVFQFKEARTAKHGTREGPPHA